MLVPEQGHRRDPPAREPPMSAQRLAGLHRLATVAVMTPPSPGTAPASGDPDATPPVPPLRVPIAAAAERGVSWLAATAADRRVVLTRFGRPTAVVDSAERLDDAARLLRAARREVVAAHCDTTADRAGRRGADLTLDEACARLGLDPERVRARARDLAG